jgi:hypothetical protein
MSALRREKDFELMNYFANAYKCLAPRRLCSVPVFWGGQRFWRGIKGPVGAILSEAEREIIEAPEQI